MLTFVEARIAGPCERIVLRVTVNAQGGASAGLSTERDVMVELEPAAVRLLTDGPYRKNFEEWTPGSQALGRLRMALTSAPDWVSDTTNEIYRVFFRRPEAEELLRWCENHVEILETFPEKADRFNGELLKRAAAAFKNGLKLSRHE